MRCGFVLSRLCLLFVKVPLLESHRFSQLFLLLSQRFLGHCLPQNQFSIKAISMQSHVWQVMATPGKLNASEDHFGRWPSRACQGELHSSLKFVPLSILASFNIKASNRIFFVK